VERIENIAAKWERKFDKEKERSEAKKLDLAREKEKTKNSNEMNNTEILNAKLEAQTNALEQNNLIDTQKNSITAKNTEITTLKDQVEFYKKELGTYRGKEAKFDQIVTLQKKQKHKERRQELSTRSGKYQFLFFFVFPIAFVTLFFR